MISKHGRLAVPHAPGKQGLGKEKFAWQLARLGAMKSRKFVQCM